MKPGDVVADRFELEQEAGAGGMGTVFRARDRQTGNIVALKVLRGHSAMETARFGRESSVLAELTHPGIVRFVATGLTSANERYLAMEWLGGEDLDARLARSGLTLDESVAIVRFAAEALAIAHARGIVHRDIKPSNLFLVGGRTDDVKLLDFGIARRKSEGRALTRTGMLIGTPEYMAPEQARGSNTLDARADVFALGCVLFECITGRPAFVGDNMMAVLAKILLEDPPRLSDLRPDVPADLDDLVAQMLDKNPAVRPLDGAAVAHALASLGTLTGALAAPRSVPPPAITVREQRIVCVVMARAERAKTDVHAPTAMLEPVEQPDALQAAVAAQGAKLEALAGGSTVAVITGQGTPRDEAARAARVALAVRAAMPEAPIVLLTGRGVITERFPVGEVIDRAAREIEFAVPGGAIRLDEVTAGLIDTRFDVGGDATGLHLRGERPIDAPRTVLGKPTSCVGRDREISTLVGLFEECATEPVARAALVLAQAGAGKSRLLQEFLTRLEQSDHAPTVLIGRGDPMSTGSPLAILGSAVRRAAGVSDGEAIEVRRRKLRARVASHVPSSDVSRVSAFLGELAAIPFEDRDDESLRAARSDPMLMNDSMQRAFEDWLAAECAVSPVVLVFEDLHWGDLPSVQFTDAALRLLRDAPFFAVALARPEVQEMFPRLWIEREPQEIRLGSLTRKACEKLIREVLGEVPADTVSRLIERSEGNAFFLEELMRAVASGTRLDVLPESVLGTVQSRIDGLSADSRRVLRAASVFGPTFWRGGVLALLGNDRRTTGVIERLDDLEAREVVSRSNAPSRLGEAEYAFRHALVRDAAYAMLTEQDRQLGHKLAGAWLESAGLRDPVVLAEHFDRGGEAVRAARWYAEAAEQSLEANDLVRAIELATRGAALVPPGDLHGRLLLVRAEARFFRGEHALSIEDALTATGETAEGSRIWFGAMSGMAMSLAQLSRYAELAELGRRLIATPFLEDARAAKAACLAHATFALITSAEREAMTALYDATMSMTDNESDIDPSTLGIIRQLRATPASLRGDLGESLATAFGAMEALDRAGNVRRAAATRNNLGFVLAQTGQYERAEKFLRESMAAADRIGAWHTHALAQHNLGLVLRIRGQFEEAIRCEQRSIEAFTRHGNVALAGASHTYLAEIFTDMGEPARGLVEAERGLEVVRANPALSVDVHTARSRALLALGRNDEAVVAAETAVALQATVIGPRGFAVLPRLTLAEALDAVGRRTEAIAVVQGARVHLEVLLDRITDPTMRQSVRVGAVENARLADLELRFGLIDP